MDKYSSKGFCDLHTHTIASGHAYSTISENAKHAHDIGLEGIAITEHGPSTFQDTSKFFFKNLYVLPNKINNVRVFKGAEANIISYDGDLDIDDDILAELDIVIASLHPSSFDYSTINESTEIYLNVMENKNIDIIGHPDDSRMYYNNEAIVKNSLKTRTLIEMNCASLSPVSYRKNAREISLNTLKLCMKHDVPIVVNSDAHFHEYVGDFTHAFSLLKEIDFPIELIVNRTLETTLEFFDI